MVLIENGISDLPVGYQTKCLEEAKGCLTHLSILFVGRLDEQKGFDLLINEFAKISPDRARLSVIGKKVVGNTDYARHENITFLSWQSRDEVWAHMRQADLVIMPSRWEGMPIVAIEAFRASCPVLASNLGPFPYIIEDGVNGIIMDISMPDFVPRALAIIEHSDLAAMKAAARATYLKKFQSIRMNRDLLSAYDRVCLTSTPLVERFMFSTFFLGSHAINQKKERK